MSQSVPIARRCARAKRENLSIGGWPLASGEPPRAQGPAARAPGGSAPVASTPPFVMLAASKTAADPESLGVVIGGSGNGEAIAANKVDGIRAALAWSEETARLGREHNNANVISIGARMHTEDEATKFVEAFIATAFSNEERHIRRIDMMSEYEKSGDLPALPQG